MEKLKQIMEEAKIEFGIMDFTKIPTLIECRAKSLLPHNAKSVIICVFPYYTGEHNPHNICKYAAVTDYHEYIKSVLNPICEELTKQYSCSFVAFTDNSPIPEVFCGVMAGLGFHGENNLLITEKYGSYVVLGEIVTDREFSYSLPNKESCLGCGICKKKCPNFAIGHNFIDYSICISNISQRKGELTKEEEDAIRRAGYLWGCDCCQDNCPHNIDIKQTNIKAFARDVEPMLSYDNIDRLLKTRAFAYKGKKLIERNLNILDNI